MEIGFVSFNQEALNRANKVMRLLQGEGAIDELGMGRIRDMLSNLMFPGMSVLQTRAKYFLLMPALYAFLERTRIADSRDARHKIREYEIAITRRLNEGAPGAPGIIGADSLRRGGDYVKYDPAYVYQAGLETYGLVRSNGNLYAMLAERSALYGNLPPKLTDKEDGADSDDLAGFEPCFLTCGEAYDFKSKEPLSIALTRKEAVFLRQRIIATQSDSLLGYILNNDLYLLADIKTFEDLDSLLPSRVTPELYRIYRLALRYSRFAYLLRMRYCILYDWAVEANDAARQLTNAFESYWHEYAEEFTPEAVGEILALTVGRVTDRNSTEFCRQAAHALTLDENLETLDRLIVRREQEIKGPRRSKLLNAKEFERGKAFEVSAPMSFRWNTIVRTTINDIREGLSHE